MTMALVIVLAAKPNEKALATMPEAHHSGGSGAANQQQSAGDEREWRRLYAKAESAWENGDLKQARALLEQIKARNPQYRDIETKIAELDSLLNEEAQVKALDSMYELAIKYEDLDKWDLAIATYEAMLQQDGYYKGVEARLETARRQQAKEQLKEELANEYANGIAAQKVRDWTRATLAFEKIVAIDRNYRDAQKRLALARRWLARENEETIVARYYAEGVAALKKNDLNTAFAALAKAHKRNPNYRDVASLLAEVESRLRQKKESTPSPASRVNVDSLYQSALVAFEMGDWVQAVVALEKIKLLRPDYRDVSDLLVRARENLKWAPNDGVNEESDSGGWLSPYLGGALAALLLLPLLGFVVFSPVMRARIFLLRGNYAAAARLYERVLARHPNKVKHYPTLANLYLLLGRSDEKALKIYKTVVHFNLATRNREEINSVVAQNYLTEGRTDSDAIEVLENALKAERRRLHMG
jgi:tetratricopeptide (TPR) repeat protein